MRKAPLLTEEEMEMVNDYILFPILLDALERDIQSLQVTQLKLGKVVAYSFHRIQDQILNDLHTLHKKLKIHGIKIYEPRRTQSHVEATYLCRGYQHRFSMLWGVVKAELEKILSNYLNFDITEG